MAKIRRIVYKKLGREKLWGEADEDTVYLDPRLKGRKHLEILIHECLHILWPRASEKQITDKAAELTRKLWQQGYRRVDGDDSQPLQDEG